MIISYCIDEEFHLNLITPSIRYPTNKSKMPSVMQTPVSKCIYMWRFASFFFKFGRFFGISIKENKLCDFLLAFLFAKPLLKRVPTRSIFFPFREGLLFRKKAETTLTDFPKVYRFPLTLALLNPDIPCICKQWGYRSEATWSGSVLSTIKYVNL